MCVCVTYGKIYLISNTHILEVAQNKLNCGNEAMAEKSHRMAHGTCHIVRWPCYDWEAAQVPKGGVKSDNHVAKMLIDR
jgi:ribosomal protein S27AE